MFESNADIDFGDDSLFNFDKFNKSVKNKRPLDPPKEETPKKQKVFQLPKNVVKRKFPGPAGLLDSSVLENTHANPEEIACSQMSLSVFQSTPWTDMVKDYEYLTERYDIKWIKTQAGRNKLKNQKAPFLGAIIKSLECFEGKKLIVNVVLKDTTGEIQGSIVKSLYEEYSNSLVPGAVVVLRQCGVLTTSYSNNHYVTIAPKNLVTIYSKNEEKLVVTSVQESEGLFSDLEEIREKEINLGPSCSQLHVKGSQEEIEEWNQAILDGVDVDSFFEDF